jgi:hypothetical protein
MGNVDRRRQDCRAGAESPVHVSTGHIGWREFTMNWRISRVLGGFVLAGAVAAASGTAAVAQSSASASPGGLVGTWLVQVTIRNCQTNAPMGSFNSLVTTHRGGTISESAGGTTFAPGQRSPGHGTWGQQEDGTYSQKMIALILFDSAPNLPGTPTFDPSKPVSPGFSAGWQTITHTLRLSGDQFASSGTNAFYKSDGSVYRTGCSTATGHRFE